MSAQIMRFEIDSDQFSGLSDHLSCRGVLDLKNPLTRFQSLDPNVFLQTVGNLLRDEDYLPFSPAFLCPDEQFPIIDIFHLELEHLSDPHTAPGHEFQNKSIARIFAPENHLVNDILFEYRPLAASAGPERLGQNRRVAWIREGEIDVVSDEIEERLEDGVLEALGGLLLTSCTSGQEGKDVVGSDGTDFPVTELVIEFVQEKAIILDRIFFPSSLSGTP